MGGGRRQQAAGSYCQLLLWTLIQHFHYVVFNFKQVFLCVFHYSVCSHAALGSHTGKPVCETPENSCGKIMKTGCSAKLTMKKGHLRKSAKPTVPLSASSGWNGAAAVRPMEDIAHKF